MELIVSEALRLAIGVHIRLRRRHFWQAVWLLDEVRVRLLELFATARGLGLVRAFDTLATPELQRRMAALLARDDLASVQRALVSALDLLEHDLSMLANATYELTPQQRVVLSALRRRIADSHGWLGRLRSTLLRGVDAVPHSHTRTPASSALSATHYANCCTTMAGRVPIE
jgi:hypothetical protein